MVHATLLLGSTPLQDGERWNGEKRRAERKRVECLAICEAFKGIFLYTPRINKTILDTYGFSTVGIIFEFFALVVKKVHVGFTDVKKSSLPALTCVSRSFNPLTMNNRTAGNFALIDRNLEITGVVLEAQHNIYTLGENRQRLLSALTERDWDKCVAYRENRQRLLSALTERNWDRCVAYRENRQRLLSALTERDWDRCVAYRENSYANQP